MYLPDGLLSDSDDEVDDIVYNDDRPREKKRPLTLADFLPKPNIPSEPIDWGTAWEPPKEVQIMAPVPKRKGEKLFVDNLRIAAINGNLEFLQKQIRDGGVDVDMPLKNEWTALLYACNHCHPHVVAFLLSCKANVNYSKKSFTPLMAAVCAAPEDTRNEDEIEERIISCVDLLFSNGAKINAQDSFKASPLHFAIKKNRLRVIAKLLDLGANVNQQDNYGYAPIHVAARFGFSHVAKLLVNRGADLTLLNDSKELPEDVATSFNAVELADLLRKKRMAEDDVEVVPPEPDDRIAFHDTQKEEKNHEAVAKAFKSDLQMFLFGVGLSKLEDLFVKNDMTRLTDVLLLDDDDLIKMGIDSLGDRKKLLKTFQEFNLSSYEKTSLPAVEPPLSKKYRLKNSMGGSRSRNAPKISATEVHSLLFNISRQLGYMKTNLRFVDRKIKKDPSILETKKEVVPFDLVVKSFNECVKSAQDVESTLKSLSSDLKSAAKMCDIEPVGFIPPQTHSIIDQDTDTVTPSYMIPPPEASFWKRLSIPLIFGCGVACGVLLTIHKFHRFFPSETHL